MSEAEITLYDRVEVRGPAGAEPALGTVIAIERRFPGGATEITYVVRVDGAGAPRAFAAGRLRPTGESAAPYRFGQTVRIIAADAEDAALVGRDAVVRGMTENDDGTFGFAVEVEGEPYVVSLRQDQIGAAGH